MRLYKYVSLNDYTLENLQKNQLYFNLLDRVNDPFECYFMFDVTEDLREDFIKFIFSCEATSGWYTEHTRRDGLNDLQNTLEIFALNKYREYILHTGVTCFSETNQSLVMWGNYANNHKGLCIEFDGNHRFFKEKVAVTYTHRPHVVSINHKDDFEINEIIRSINRGNSKKHIDWHYEAEWRLVGEPYEKRVYPLDAIKAIYIGNVGVERRITTGTNYKLF